jgi:dethiobiotin synthase
MIRGLFVTGTDTGVGKTVVSSALMHHYRHQVKLCYWKPIQTGIEEDDDTGTVRALGQCSDEEVLDQGVRLKRPLSPHLAAKLSGTNIDLQQVYGILLPQLARNATWIIEGAGGMLVPINDRVMMVDLARMLNLPVLVVARTKLGTINHTLLTLEALRRRALEIAGVVMVGERNSSNREAIETYGAVTVLGEMPFFSEVTGESIKSWVSKEFDQRSSLLAQLQLEHHELVPTA